MKITCELDTARQARHLAEDRHEDLVCEMRESIKSSIAAHNRRKSSLGCGAATPDERTSGSLSMMG